MSGVNYGKMAVKAASKVAKYGATAVLVRHVPGGEYDPATGTVAPGEDIRHECKAVLSRPEARLVDGTTVLAGDMLATIGVPGVPFIPTIGDDLEVAGETWKAMQAMHVKPGDEYVLFKVLVRK